MKKTIITTLLLCTLAHCELPPPYLQRAGFRPSPQLLSNRPVAQQITSLDVQIPARLTIEQLIRLTEQLQSTRNNKPKKILVNVPENSYLPPPREPQRTYGPPETLGLNRPQTVRFAPQDGQNSHRFPNKVQTSQLYPNILQKPQTFPYKVQNPQPFPNELQDPQNFPNKVQSPQNQAQNLVPQNLYNAPITQQSVFPPNQQAIPPSTSYGIPDTRNIETFGEQNNVEAILRQTLLNHLQQQQHLPYKPPSGFRPQLQQPQNGFGGNGTPQGTLGISNSLPNNGGQNYLPPQTTPGSGFAPSTTTLRPVTTATTPRAVEVSTSYDNDYDKSTTETSLADPNISVANAVAGAGNFFYLQQPNGMLQKVVLQKSQEPNSKPEEYVANYYFQNIQALPNAVYTPLIALGSYARK